MERLGLRGFEYTDAALSVGRDFPRTYFVVTSGSGSSTNVASLADLRKRRLLRRADVIEAERAITSGRLSIAPIPNGCESR